MPRNSLPSLSSSIVAPGALNSHVAWGTQSSATWEDLAAGNIFHYRADNYRGRSVVLATDNTYAAIGAMIQLDGVARRMVLYPPDLPLEHIAFVAETAAADFIVTDLPAPEAIRSRIECIVPSIVPSIAPCGRAAAGGDTVSGTRNRPSEFETEWVLLTSGTTGLPKLTVHTFASLTGAIERKASATPSVIWSTFYDIRRYGGLQIFLRAALTGTSLVLKGAKESTADFLARAGAQGVTHISGTPSHWRGALMSDSAHKIAPRYVRLSGEIADQAILNHLSLQYPQAKLAHAFASTEAGLAFEVNDGLMGFPVEVLAQNPSVAMKAEGGTLRVCSDRTAVCYLGRESQPLKDSEGYVDTGDLLELRAGRYYFTGREDGIINVGGLKVHPEEVEAVINRHPRVSVSLVRMKKSPITGAIVIADVVLKTPQSVPDAATQIERSIMQFCRGELALHKIPASINFVSALAVAETGKLIRRHA
jgi:acyl-CoA synthetase (AMP-forming)/AMP-acid ligase II